MSRVAADATACATAARRGERGGARRLHGASGCCSCVRREQQRAGATGLSRCQLIFVRSGVARLAPPRHASRGHARQAGPSCAPQPAARPSAMAEAAPEKKSRSCCFGGGADHPLTDAERCVPTLLPRLQPRCGRRRARRGVQRGSCPVRVPWERQRSGSSSLAASWRSLGQGASACVPARPCCACASAASAAPRARGAAAERVRCASRAPARLRYALPCIRFAQTPTAAMAASRALLRADAPLPALA